MIAQSNKELIQVSLINDFERYADVDFEKAIYGLGKEIDLLSSNADTLDYLISIGSGVLCGILDILWLGEFDLTNGRNIAEKKTEDFVVRIAKSFGCESTDLKSCVKFLEVKFPIPSDGNTPNFGGGLQHHLRDFAHHPTILGLIFSILTQFTCKSYGTNTNGNFRIYDIPQKSAHYIGEDIETKIFNGTIIWFFHLISDIAGSSITAGLSGGTGIPGPILSLAKEIATLPLFKDATINGDSISKIISKLFNGTLFAKYDANGIIRKENITKIDFRGELGVLIELGKQAVPVIANECIVRAFYFIRRFALEMKVNEVKSPTDLTAIDWNKVKPYKNSTITRMLTISTGVFTTLDVSHAVLTQSYFVSVNFIGVGRFGMALGSETINYLKVHDVKKIKRMYKEIQKNTFMSTDNNIYKRMSDDMNIEKLGLNIE